MENSSKKNVYTAAITAVFTILIGILAILCVLLVIKFSSKDDEVDGANAGVVKPSEAGTEDTTSGIADYEAGTRTIMIYMIGSDLETQYGSGTQDLSEMMKAEYGDNISLVVQTGGALDWHTDYIKDGEVQRFEVKENGLYELESLGKVNMSRYKTLTDFIKFASETYPAEKYTLVLWDHGGSIPISFGYDEVFNTGLITEADIGKALKNAGISFETIIMDACNMCTLEVAMAVKDYADYLVAAESTVIGTGLYYTSWLDYLGENVDAQPVDYCELIVKDYMETAEAARTEASMSYIDLSKIEAVYDAYNSYMEAVYSDIENGKYAEYVKAREECGLYTGTESVDLTTLARKYRTDESSALIKAVKDAVGYTDSDYAFGHGLAAYSPNEYSYAYESARESLEVLKYDDEVLKCFDAFVSLKLAYLGSDYVDEYAGDWYDEEMVRSYMADQNQSQEYPLPTEKINGYDAVCLTAEQWEIVSSFTVEVCVGMDEENYLILGREYYGEIDGDNNIILDVPECWTYVNGYPVSYVCTYSYYEYDTGVWEQAGAVLAKCNGEEVLLILYYDEEYQEGKLVGYMPYDFETQTTPDGRARVMLFDDDDEIELIHPLINTSTLSITYDNVLGKSIKASDIVLSYLPISYGEHDVICTFELTDIYGNKYRTESFVY